MANAKASIEILDNVTFVFVKMAEPAPNYNKDGTEYTTSVVVDEDTADSLCDTFQKLSVKKIKTVDFKDKYKIDAPFKDQKNQFVLTFKQPAEKNGVVSKFRPKVMLLQEDGTSIDITTAKLVANGSKGKLAYKAADGKAGPHPYLHSILVEEFIEYVPTGKNTNVFGVPVAGVAPTDPDVIADRKKANAEGEVKRIQNEARQVTQEEIEEDTPF